MILVLKAFSVTAQTTNNITLLEGENIAVLTELPYEWCLVSRPCGGGLFWISTLKYEIVYPIKDTILVQIICPYRHLKNIKTGILIKIRLAEKELIYASENFNTYLDDIAPVYNLVYLKRGFIFWGKKRGILSLKEYKKKYMYRVQDNNNRPCACCGLSK